MLSSYFYFDPSPSIVSPCLWMTNWLTDDLVETWMNWSLLIGIFNQMLLLMMDNMQNKQTLQTKHTKRNLPNQTKPNIPNQIFHWIPVFLTITFAIFPIYYHCTVRSVWVMWKRFRSWGKVSLYFKLLIWLKQSTPGSAVPLAMFLEEITLPLPMKHHHS